MRVVLLGALFGFLAFRAWMLFVVAAVHFLDERRPQMKAARPVRPQPVTREEWLDELGEEAKKAWNPPPKLLADIAEPLTVEEMRELDELAAEEDFNFDMGLFAVELADPLLVESTVEWVIAKAQEEFRRREEAA